MQSFICHDLFAICYALWVRVILGCASYWVRVILGARHTGCASYWVRVILGERHTGGDASDKELTVVKNRKNLLQVKMMDDFINLPHNRHANSCFHVIDNANNLFCFFNFEFLVDVFFSRLPV